MIGKDLDERVVDDLPAIENRRVLLGFLSKVQAVQFLTNSHLVRNPVDHSEDGAPISEDLRDDFIQMWENARTSQNDPPSFLPGNVDIEDLPDDEEVRDYMDNFRSQNHVQNLHGGLRDDQWTFGRFPIDKLVAFQASVATDGHANVPTSEDEFLDKIKYCLPIRKKKLIMRSKIDHMNRCGYEIVSRGPNIHLDHPSFDRDEDTDEITVSFKIRPNTNVVNIVKHRNRYILKNGYHRCFQLRRAGESHVPAFIWSTEDPQEAGINGSYISNDQVFSGRPPLVYDYFTDAATDVDFPTQNKQIRIIGESNNVRR